MAEIDLNFNSSIQNLPSNSDKLKNGKEPVKEKHLQKVVKNEVTIKKKSLFSKFKKDVVSKDAGTVGEYVLKDVILPTIKDLIYNSIRGSLEMVLWGTTKPSKKNVPYNSISSGTYHYNGITNGVSKKEQSNHKRSIDYFDVNNIMFDTRADATNILDNLRMILEEYPSVSINDFYDLMGLSAPHTANDYGWTDLRDAEVQMFRGKYYIALPEYKLIK